MNQAQARMLRAKKLGALIRNARMNAQLSSADLAQLLNISEDNIHAFETGNASPSLPQLEAIAFTCDVPLEHFFGNRVIESGQDKQLNPDSLPRLQLVRQKMIGAQIRKYRIESGMSITQLATASGMTETQIERIELGAEPVDLPLLEVLAGAMQRSLEEFQDQRGPVGLWLQQRRAIAAFHELDPELRAFMVQPSNRPFLELAMKMSEFPVKKLRTIAESLLEITL